MTRFARAKGSKSSNERNPEEATPWHVMKQEMQKTKGQKQASSTESTAKKYMAFTENEAYGSTWAEFEVGKSEQQSKHSKGVHKDVSSLANCDMDGIVKKKKNKKNKLHQIADGTSKVGKPLLKKFSKKSEIKNTSPNVVNKNAKFENFVTQENYESSENGSSKRNKTASNKKNKTFTKEVKQTLKNKDKAAKKIQGVKERSTKNHTRRKPEDTGSTIMFINGKEIEVVKYDGFPVKKEDAIRLGELKEKLKAKGIPHESIVTTMKLERRRAEKALARERKKVCFHCRKSGHVLSDCPELTKTDENEAGICFKCGSTEHTHFQCKVSRGDDYRYASCFICKEQGHIARQCPDNPRGLYPKGGACKVCGAVTHLKKDCPDLIQEKEQQTITLKTLNTDHLEALDDDINTSEPSMLEKAKKKKVVKF